MNFLSRLFSRPPLPALSAQDLNEKLTHGKQHPLVLDVRQPDEYRAGHIAGAKLIPLGELEQRLKELPREREMVCVCTSGSRSGSATKMLLAAGYHAINMNGGMSAWQRAGLPVKKGSAAA